ncbi:hypothetical protein POTOM_051361 [Populus tomentosa]|uniref:Uncharacterized protein n=1 Tax=Populus tomentosa TaxID=118781 RepID=A0A8X7YA09_POPTO|nr:hypothetical protein POTOM_051361 [Populus tomentosa]
MLQSLGGLNRNDDDLHMRDQEVSDVKRVLFLLENQLPYGPGYVDELEGKPSPPSAPKNKKRTNGDKQHSAGPAHLLKLLHSKFIPEETNESGDSGHRGHYLYYSVKDLEKHLPFSKAVSTSAGVYFLPPWC